MRARRTLTRPVAAATLLATLALPSIASAAPPAPAPLPQPVAPKLAKPVAVAIAPIVKHVKLTRHAASSRYRVKEGDCLWFIARAYLGRGRKWRTIYDANRDLIRNPDLIFPGQILTIPRRPESVQSRHERRHHRHLNSRISHKQAANHVRVSELFGHSSHHSPTAQAPEAALPVDSTREARLRTTSEVLEPPAQPSHEATQLVGETFQGHRRINNHFYELRHGKMVWADDGNPVHGSWSKRVSEQIYPDREVFEPQPVQEAPKEVFEAPTAVQSVDAPDEPTIQGHRRVNGTFFVRHLNSLLWADTGEPVRPAQGSLVAP